MHTSICAKETQIKVRHNEPKQTKQKVTATKHWLQERKKII